jgi:hypothetical protein
MMKKNLAPSLHPHESATAGLSRIVRQLVEGALALIERPTGEPDEDTHEIRISIKRLRALLLLIRPVVADKSFERENARLRNAARRLAVSRDTAVARKTLLALAKSADGKRERDAFARVLHGFHRMVEPPDMTDRGAALREVAAALRLSGKNIPRLRLPADDWKAIGPGLEAVYFGGACAIQCVISGMDRRSQKLRKISLNLGHAVYRQKPGDFAGQFGKQWCKWRTPDSAARKSPAFC